MCRWIALALIIVVPTCVGGQAWAQATPTVGNLQMPLVSPQQADQYFANRVVPPSDVPATAPLTASQPLQSVNVDPVLGHDLPGDAVTASGLPRADFATASSGKEQKKSALGSQVAIAPRGPGSVVIHQEPPVIGKP